MVSYIPGISASGALAPGLSAATVRAVLELLSSAEIAAAYMPLAGGMMAGSIDMGGYNLINADTISAIVIDKNGFPVATEAYASNALNLTSGTVPFARLPVGTTSVTVCAGNDPRLSDARTPLAHTHAATEITTGTLDDARLSGNVPRLNAASNAFTGSMTIGGNLNLVDGTADIFASGSGASRSIAIRPQPGASGLGCTIIRNGIIAGVGWGATVTIQTDNTPQGQINCSAGPLRYAATEHRFRGTDGSADGPITCSNITASGTLRVGGGTIVQNILSATATLDFPSIAASSFADLTITVTGAVSGDTVIVNPIAGSATTDVVYTGWVSAANTVTIRASNVSSTTARDPASGTFRATVVRF